MMSTGKVNPGFEIAPGFGVWFSKCAPLFVGCQQQDIMKINKDIPGCGPRRLVTVLRGLHEPVALLTCGHTLPFSWLAMWERSACQAALDRFHRR